MPPVPPLVMSSPQGLGSLGTPRSARPRTTPSYRADCGTFTRQARHIVAPQVGLNAMVSALGGLKAPWEVSATQKFTPRLSHPPETHRPFSVGRSRAQNMLAVALATQDDQAKVRRLEQALETPCVRYERAQTPRLMQVARDATVLRGELTRKDRKKAWQDKQEKEKKEEKEEKEEKQEKSEAHENPKPPPSPEDLLKEEEAAALRIQSLYRGQKDRQTVKAMAAQEAQAATRIQSIYRGQVARREIRAE